ncbi:MAG: hypothetical protein ABFC57_17500 [Veillonellales bacterium]
MLSNKTLPLFVPRWREVGRVSEGWRKAPMVDFPLTVNREL